MEKQKRLMNRIGRVLGLVCLLLGLANASRLLGLWSGDVSPLTTLGRMGFIYLAVFSLGQLFAAVGLWIEASWGAVVLIGATATELGMALTGNADVHLSLLGILVRFVLLLGGIAMLAYAQRHLTEYLHD